MKRIIYILAILAVATVSHSCVKDDAECPDILNGQGAVSLNLGLAGDTRGTKGVTATDYPGSSSDIRIYSKAGLVRHYTSLNDVPQEIWMVAGSYNVKVTLGDKVSPTFDYPYFYAEAPLEIEAGKTSQADVVCKLQNTAIQVNFDSSVPENFKAYSVKVMVGETFDEKGACLTYDNDTKNKDGYFIVPENANKISFKFEGTLQSGDTYSKEYKGIELDESKLIGYRHTVNLKYTPPVSGNESGYISWNVKVSLNPIDEKEDIWGINPAPRPSIGTDDDSDVKEPVNGAEGVSYIINSPSGVIKKIELKLNNGQPVTVDCSTESDKDGISVEFIEDADAVTRAGEASGSQNIKLTLKPEFFESLDEAGEYNLNIRAYSSDTVYGEITAQVRIEGIYLFEANTWKGVVEIEAFAFGDTVKIEYQKGTGSWTDGSATITDDGSYSAVIAIEPGTTYKYRLTSNGETIGEKTLTTEAGVQIYNAGFETWTGSSPLLPYTDSSDQFWDTGNHGSSTLNKNVTTNSTDKHTGNYSAYLKSQYVSALGIGKFAAGNIFVGRYIGTYQTTNGCIAMGKEFSYNFKPKKLKFWCKALAGTIDRDDSSAPVKKGDQDVNEIYICITKMGGPHLVKTHKDDRDTFLTIDDIETIDYCTDRNITTSSNNDNKDGHVIAWGVWRNSGTISDWTEQEIELHYNKKYEDEVPNYLMLTASASKYGDYFTGSTSSYIYLDDIEFVY